MPRKLQFLVIGAGDISANEKAEEIAFAVGKEIAKRGHVLVTGGKGGVMEAASKGAHSEKGLVVGVIPEKEKSEANEFCDIVIATGVGLARNYINCYSSDAVIVVNGKIGTRVESIVACDLKLPFAAFPEAGGYAAEIAGKDLLGNGHVVKGFSDVKECVDFLENEIERNKSKIAGM